MDIYKRYLFVQEVETVLQSSPVYPFWQMQVPLLQKPLLEHWFLQNYNYEQKLAILDGQVNFP